MIDHEMIDVVDTAADQRIELLARLRAARAEYQVVKHRVSIGSIVAALVVTGLPTVAVAIAARNDGGSAWVGGLQTYVSFWVLFALVAYAAGWLAFAMFPNVFARQLVACRRAVSVAEMTLNAHDAAAHYQPEVL
jgi:hypothetical protein